MKLTERQILKEAIKQRNVKFLVRWYFDSTLTPTQAIIVREIAFEEHRKFSISAMTRYGKSWCIAIAIGLFIILNEKKKIFFVAPTAEQSLILRDYLAGFVRNTPALLEIADMSAVEDERLTIQRSRSHQTFKNNCSYRVFTAHNDADTLMGHGLGNEGGILIIDEACQIKDTAYAKIVRMLGDNPEKSIVVELFNPWTRDCRAFEHSIDPSYRKFHIGWELALKEGRTTKAFIDERRAEFTPIEFEVLYESKFPDASEDSIFSLSKINLAIKNHVVFDSNTRIISCDVADKGLDYTVIMTGRKHKDKDLYVVEDIYTEAKSENVQIARKICRIIIRDRHIFEKIIVNIDTIGLGEGVVSNVKAFVLENKIACEVVGCHYGKKAIFDEERFSNMKAENFFRLKDLFDQEMIYIPNDKKLTKELISMKWKFSSNSKIVIEDPDKSPDFADSLVYFVWRDKKLYGGGGYIA